MKTLLLASVTALTFGVGSAFAATTPAGWDNTQQPAVTGTQTGSGAYLTSGANNTAPSNAPGTYAYNGQYDGGYGATPRLQAGPMSVVPQTPLGAAEAYQDDAQGDA